MAKGTSHPKHSARTHAHNHNHNHNHPEKPRSSKRPSARTSDRSTTRTTPSTASSRMQPATPHVYQLPGPHGSVSVRAMANSPYLHARSNDYAIRDSAYIKQVYTPDGDQHVFMNFQLTSGLLLRPNVRQPKIVYPDRTFLHAVPMSDVTVLSMASVYHHGRGRQYMHTPAEVYGRDSVLVVMRSAVLEKLKRSVARLYERQYPRDEMFSFGQRDHTHPQISFVPCTVRRAAKFVVRVNNVVKERRVDRVVGWENHDLCGDALIAMKYVRNPAKHTAELVFELEDVIIRRGGEQLLQER